MDTGACRSPEPPSPTPPLSDAVSLPIGIKRLDLISLICYPIYIKQGMLTLHLNSTGGRGYEIPSGFSGTLNLVGCMSLPVEGEFKDGSEKFWGDATGYAVPFRPSFGPINILSDQGGKCGGSFHYYWFNSGGEGRFDCEDGRVGDFFFSSNRTEGKGFGRDNKGNHFIIQFGGPEYTAARAAQWGAAANSFDAMARANRPSTSYCTQYGNSYRCSHYNY